MSGWDASKPMTGSRLIELAVAVLISSLISSALTATISIHVMNERVGNLQASQEEIKEQIRDLRRDIYRPAWPDSMDLSAPTLISELKQSLHSAAAQFDGLPDDPDADFRRLIRAATADLSQHRGRTALGEITLTAGQSRYVAPPDILYIKTVLWGHDRRISPWSDAYAGPLPRARAAFGAIAPEILLTPAPTAHQLSSYGSQFTFYYAADIWAGGENDPIRLERPSDRDLLLLRAQAEACRELALMGVARVGETKMRMAQSSNMTPAALAEKLLAEYRMRLGVAA